MNEAPQIIVASESGVSIRSLEDISEAIGTCLGSKGLILTEADLGPEFFNLKSRFAGELLQKFVNYRIRVAIVITNPASYGERFAELTYEHSTHPLIRFVGSTQAARTWLES